MFDKLAAEKLVLLPKRLETTWFSAFNQNNATVVQGNLSVQGMGLGVIAAQVSEQGNFSYVGQSN